VAISPITVLAERQWPAYGSLFVITDMEHHGKLHMMDNLTVVPSSADRQVAGAVR
jgi:hypothetical protein